MSGCKGLLGLRNQTEESFKLISERFNLKGDKFVVCSQNCMWFRRMNNFLIFWHFIHIISKKIQVMFFELFMTKAAIEVQ